MKTLRLAGVLCAIISISAFAQTSSTDIVPGDNLVTDGIASIPASIAATTTRYTEFRTASMQDWHPSERSLLVTTRFGDTSQAHQLKFPGGDRSQLTFFPDRVLAASYQPTKGDYFLFLKDVGGGEWFQIYRYDFSTGDSTLLTDGKSRNLGVQWNHAGLVANGQGRGPWLRQEEECRLPVLRHGQLCRGVSDEVGRFATTGVFSDLGTRPEYWEPSRPLR